MYEYLIIYGLMIVKLVLAIVSVVIFMHFFSSSGNLKQSTPLSVIINFLLSAILSGFILNDRINILEFTIVVLIYGGIISALNRLAFYTNFGRRMFVGIPKVLVQNGQLNTKRMQKLKISARDLVVAMRKHKIRSLDDIEMAQIEPTGELTIVKKGAEKYSIVLIDNGIIDHIALKKINRTEKWLRQKLREKKITTTDNIFVAQWHHGKLYIVKKNKGLNNATPPTQKSNT